MRFLGKEIRAGHWLFAGALVAAMAYAMVRWGSSADRGLQVTVLEFKSREEAEQAIARSERDPLPAFEGPVLFDVVRLEKEAGPGDRAFSFELHSRLLSLPSGVYFAVLEGRRVLYVIIFVRGTKETPDLRKRTRSALEGAVRKVRGQARGGMD